MATPPADYERSIGFVKFKHAIHNLTIDARNKRATVESTIRFKLAGSAGGPRLPVIDFADPGSIVSMTLDRVSKSLPDTNVWWDRISSPDRDARYMVLDQTVDPGEEYEVVINHELDLSQDRLGNDGSLVFFRMSHAKHFEQGARGRDKDRLFLERYLPSNLEFDQHGVELNVELTNTGGKKHQLYTNGVVSHEANRDSSDKNAKKFTVNYPETYTSSSPFFFLGRERKLASVEVEKPQGFSGVWPQIIVFGKRRSIRRLGDAVTKQVRLHLPDLITRFGPYPHTDRPLLLFVGSHGIEYVNAAEVTVGNVQHELVHQYFGRWVLPRDGNAGWIDEAISHWIESGAIPYEQAPDYEDAHLGAGSPYRRATDMRSRTLGPLVLGHLDFLLKEHSNDRVGMVEFLRHLVKEKPMTPITSEEFRDSMKLFAKGAEANIDEIFNDYIL